MAVSIVRNVSHAEMFLVAMKVHPCITKNRLGNYMQKRKKKRRKKSQNSIKNEENK